MPWSEEELEAIGDATELEIAAKRSDGTLRSWLPIWVVCARGQVYVRTWHRRDTGWFGQVLRSRRARVRVPGVELDVLVEDLGETDSGLRASVDDGYRAKYGGAGDSSVSGMVSDEAAGATLLLSPDR